MNKITVEMINEHGRRFAIAKAFVPQEVNMLRDVPLMTIRIDHASITLPRETLGRMIAAAQNAEITGSEYPDDWRRFSEVDAPLTLRRMPGAPALDDARGIIRDLLCYTAGHRDGCLPEWGRVIQRARAFLGDDK